MFKRLAQQLKISDIKSSSFPVSRPWGGKKYVADKNFLDKLSKHALSEYEKKMSIKKFTKLTLSDPEDCSHNDLVENLFETGVADDIQSVSSIKSLAVNPKLLKDLGL